ncbi:MAG: M48 family metallopeptidase [Deltaproteobacteria bacterium]|nr:M48 family metallopeptidase [Deltaproteobacteria bacterium]
MNTPASSVPVSLARLTLKELRLEKEEIYWGVLLFFTASSALMLLLFVPVVLVALALFVCLQQLFLAHVRGNGVKVTAAQFPELFGRIKAGSDRLGLARPPETYVVQQGGSLNALATKLFSRNFVILYSDLIEACGADDKALDFVIGHELGHIALGHLRRALWILPGRLVPLIAQAYSRACEYSCDRCGLVVAGDLEPASRGLLALAAGGTMARRASVPAFSEQAWVETRGFWAHVYELNATHPYLSKRVRALRDFLTPGSEPAIRRRLLPILVAPMLGQPVAFAVVVVYLSFIGAAIGIPAFLKAQGLSARAEARAALERCHAAQAAFHAKEGRYAATFAELGLDDGQPLERYTLYMGDNQLGPDKAVSPTLRGYADAEDYACVAVNNLDDDDTWDVWVIDPTLSAPHLYVNDENDQVVDWRGNSAEVEDRADQ